MCELKMIIKGKNAVSEASLSFEARGPAMMLMFSMEAMAPYFADIADAQEMDGSLSVTMEATLDDIPIGGELPLIVIDNITAALLLKTGGSQSLAN